jgi:hypothetical protein
MKKYIVLMTVIFTGCILANGPVPDDVAGFTLHDLQDRAIKSAMERRNK